MEGNGIGDKEIICKDCGKPFIFSKGEQLFFNSKQLSEPKRCIICRKKRRDSLVPDSGVGYNGK